MDFSLHSDTIYYLDSVAGALHEAKDNTFAKEKILRFVNKLLLRKDSWYESIEYLNSRQAKGSCLWEWIKALDKNTQSLLLRHIEKEQNHNGENQ